MIKIISWFFLPVYVYLPLLVPSEGPRDHNKEQVTQVWRHFYPLHIIHVYNLKRLHYTFTSTVRNTIQLCKIKKFQHLNFEKNIHIFSVSVENNEMRTWSREKVSSSTSYRHSMKEPMCSWESPWSATPKKVVVVPLGSVCSTTDAWEWKGINMNRKWLDNDTNDSLAIWLYDDITDYPLSCTIGHIHGWPKVQDLFRQLYEMICIN